MVGFLFLFLNGGCSKLAAKQNVRDKTERESRPSIHTLSFNELTNIELTKYKKTQEIKQQREKPHTKSFNSIVKILTSTSFENNIAFISKNDESGSGGAVFANNCFVKCGELNDGADHNKRVKFIHNKAILGGAISALSSIVDLSNTDFKLNEAEKHGGAIYIKQAEKSLPLILLSCSLESNKAHLTGGAICLHSISNIAIDKTDFVSNSCDYSGGAVFSSNVDEIRFSTVKFYKNFVTFDKILTKNDKICSSAKSGGNHVAIATATPCHLISSFTAFVAENSNIEINLEGEVNWESFEDIVNLDAVYKSNGAKINLIENRILNEEANTTEASTVVVTTWSISYSTSPILLFVKSGQKYYDGRQYTTAQSEGIVLAYSFIEIEVPVIYTGKDEPIDEEEPIYKKPAFIGGVVAGGVALIVIIAVVVVVIAKRRSKANQFEPQDDYSISTQSSDVEMPEDVIKSAKKKKKDEENEPMWKVTIVDQSDMDPFCQQFENDPNDPTRYMTCTVDPDLPEGEKDKNENEAKPKKKSFHSEKEPQKQNNEDIQNHKDNSSAENNQPQHNNDDLSQQKVEENPAQQEVNNNYENNQQQQKVDDNANKSNEAEAQQQNIDEKNKSQNGEELGSQQKEETSAPQNVENQITNDGPEQAFASIDADIGQA